MTRPKLDIPPGVTVVSPSQIATAEECWRKWGYAYILGQREPGGRGATFGGVVHERHEAYLEHGTVPDRDETWTFRRHLENEIASGDTKREDAAMHLCYFVPDNQLDKPMYPGKVMLNMMPEGIYPAPRTGEVEKHFVYRHSPRIWYQGLVDWHAYDLATRRLKVIDHKTSSDPQRYGLTTEPTETRGQLRTSKQAIIYARALLDMYTAVDATPQVIDMFWNYGKSDGVRKHSYVANATFDNVGEVYARFENVVHPWAVEIHRLKMMGADPLTLDPNPQSCWLYNQECSHARECNLTSEDKIGALLMTAPGNSILQGLLGATGGPPPNQGAAPPPVVAGDRVSPPEAAGPVATVPTVAIAAPLPVPPRPATGPLPTAIAQASVAAAAALPAPAAPLPAPAPAAPAVAPVAPVAPVLQLPDNFWQNVVTELVTALKAGLK